jgi:hypothetical protein
MQLNPQLLPTWNSDYSNGGTEAFLTPCTKFTASFTTKINVTTPPGFSFKVSDSFVVPEVAPKGGF